MFFPFEFVYHRRRNRKTTMTWRLTFFVVAIAILLGSGRTARSVPRRALTFAERVAYQYAIEEVYWRHRIWPKENPKPKPLLDAVMSRAQIEKKVEDYLRNSHLLADQRWPIKSADLQAEMDRMAAHTKQPDVLRELFAALNNDSFVVAECLARPILAERLVSNRAVVAGVSPAQTNSSAADTAASTEEDSAAYTLPQISAPLDCVNDTWTSTPLPSGISRRALHTAVWTGSEMIIWGGWDNVAPSNTGSRYNPSTDSWTFISVTNATPTARSLHTAIWTGSEMIIWAGADTSNHLNTGGRYKPSTDSWTVTSTTNAPTARENHTAVWTGSEMIVWGGTSGSYLNTGGRYNPGTDIWTTTSSNNAPIGRDQHTAIWTGSEMIAWGGYFFDGSDHYLNNGGRYNPTMDSWTGVSTTNVPDARNQHTAVWTGSEMIIWGGGNGSNGFNTGGRYNPGANNWTATSTINAPDARTAHTAIWTGTEMIIWGGYAFDLGRRYNPGTDNWTTTSMNNAPVYRANHTAVWTGSQMIVWGGYDWFDKMYLKTGGRYCAQPSAPVLQTAASRKIHGGAGSFDVNLPVSGTPGIECRSGGSTNDYTMVVAFLANVSVNGSPQAAVTLGSGTVGSEGISNGGMVTISGNIVTIPLTNVVNVQTINVTLNSVNTSTSIVIPMSILIGDTNANATVNAADVAQTKSRLGQPVDDTNFRSDVNANGSINAADSAIVKQNSGTSLPP